MRWIFAILFLITFSAQAQLSLRNTLHQEIESPYQVSAQYSTSTDFLDPVRPRRFEHDVSLNTIYNWNDRFRTGMLADITYFTLERDIVETQAGYGNVQPSLNFFTTYVLKTPFLTSHNIGASYFLPLDEFSRLEGYNGIASVNTTLVKRIWSRITFIQGFRGSYMLNSFDKNALGVPNRTYSVSATPMISFGLTSKISFLVGAGVRWGEFTDGNNDYSYNNFQTLNFSHKKFSVFVTHFNGGYTENGELYLWFIDRNRKFISAGISYDF